MDTKVVHEVSVDVLTLFFNGSLVLLFLYLRLKGDKEPLTLSQRWALTILISIFFLNSIEIVLDLVSEFPSVIGNIKTAFFIGRLNADLDVMIGLMLLSFGLVYPRPYTGWTKLYLILFSILVLVFLVVGIQIFGHRSMDHDVYVATSLSGYTYPIGWYIPVILWLPNYEKETSVHSRMVLALFTWGFILNASAGGINQVIRIITGAQSYTLYGLISITLFLYVITRITLILWKTRGNWALPERIHALFLISLFSATIIENLTLDWSAEVSSFFGFITGNAAWTLVRPALFSYAIIRYQLFGPKLRIDRPISIVLGAVSSMLVAVTVGRLLWWTRPEVFAGCILLITFILFLPAWKLASRQVRRFLPMAGSERATMVEKRAKYLISLQTAIVKGVIDNREDEAALEIQRGRLGISKREHDLLLDSFAERERWMATIEELDEIFLVHFDGRLLVHIERKVEGAGKGKDKDIVAGMLVAIKDYVQEGLRTGGGRGMSLDSIRYGNYSLVIETEGKLVLAAVVKGPGSTELRQDLQDQFKLINRRFGKDLEDWDGNLSKIEGAKHILEGFLEEMALL